MNKTQLEDQAIGSSCYKGFDKQYMAGQWREGSADRFLTNINPYNGDTLTTIRLANQADVDNCYHNARQIQPIWGNMLPIERMQILQRVAGILEKRSEEIISWIIRESGSTRIKAIIELESAHAITLESASFPLRAEGAILPSCIAHQESRMYREPLGVVGVISPWNFPFHLTMRSVAPALALGNAVVIKPASDTPISGGLLLAKIFEEAGLPPGLLHVVAGSGREIGDYFVSHPVPQLISFTGSSSVGQNVGKIACGEKHLKRIALELGGNAPLVVLDDADVEQAANAAIFGRFLHQGQICMSTNRAIVDQKIYDAFVESVVNKAKTLHVGDPNDIHTAIGPIIDGKQLAGIQEKISNAQKAGAKLLLGGETKGQLLPPHIFVDVQPEWAIARDEIFGPVLPIIKAQNETHALQLANNTEYGLSSAVFTQNTERGVRFARGIMAGMTHINDISVDDQTNAPFGGEKNSGLGRFNGRWAIEEFTRAHWITLQYQPRPYPF